MSSERTEPWASANPRRYDRFGEYFELAKSPEFEARPRVALDRLGLPRNQYAEAYFYNPVTISQYGLRHYGRWLQRRLGSDREKMQRAANWLLANQGRDGRWPYRFTYTVAKMGTSPGVTLAPPWSSAMAQGQGMSLLVRTWRMTGNRRYLTAARRAVKPLAIDVARGGLKRRLAGGPFFEEYPTTPPSHVLNGFMFTIIGLWDVAPWSREAANLYRESRRTLLRALPLFDRGPGKASAYHLGFRTAGQPVYVLPAYHDLHRAQLGVLDAIEPHPRLPAFRKRWRIPPASTVTGPPEARSVRVPVLTYHRVHRYEAERQKSVPDLTVEPEVFERSIAALKHRQFRSITNRQLYDALFEGKPLPPKPVLITVDDGYRDAVTNVVPVLRRHGMTATFFVVTGRLGRDQYLTREDVRALEAAGMDIGGHTSSHRDLTTLPEAELQRETTGSRRELAELLGHPVDFFAYPFGRHNTKAVAAVRQAGYRVAFTTESGNLLSSASALSLPRIHVGRGTRPAQVVESAEHVP